MIKIGHSVRKGYIHIKVTQCKSKDCIVNARKLLELAEYIGTLKKSFNLNTAQSKQTLIKKDKRHVYENVLIPFSQKEKPKL